MEKEFIKFSKDFMYVIGTMDRDRGAISSF